MTKEELLAVFGTGKIGALVRYDQTTNKCLLQFWGLPEDIEEIQTPDFLAALKAYQGELAMMLAAHTAEVCMNPRDHFEFRRTMYWHNGMPYTSCLACAEVRQAKLAEGGDDLPPPAYNLSFT